jgi:hypothetical protein
MIHEDNIKDIHVVISGYNQIIATINPIEGGNKKQQVLFSDWLKATN